MSKLELATLLASETLQCSVVATEVCVDVCECQGCEGKNQRIPLCALRFSCKALRFSCKALIWRPNGERKPIFALLYSELTPTRLQVSGWWMWIWVWSPNHVRTRHVETNNKQDPCILFGCWIQLIDKRFRCVTDSELKGFYYLVPRYGRRQRETCMGSNKNSLNHEGFLSLVHN